MMNRQKAYLHLTQIALVVALITAFFCQITDAIDLSFTQIGVLTNLVNILWVMDGLVIVVAESKHIASVIRSSKPVMNT